MTSAASVSRPVDPHHHNRVTGTGVTQHCAKPGPLSRVDIPDSLLLSARFNSEDDALLAEALAVMVRLLLGQP